MKFKYLNYTQISKTCSTHGPSFTHVTEILRSPLKDKLLLALDAEEAMIMWHFHQDND